MTRIQGWKGTVRCRRDPPCAKHGIARHDMGLQYGRVAALEEISVKISAAEVKCCVHANPWASPAGSNTVGPHITLERA